jgi:arginine utilization protein RocB
MDKVVSLEARIKELKQQLDAEASALAYIQYADGQAYYEERRRFTVIREELFRLERELRALTVHTCYIPQYIATERLRAKLETAKQARIQAALKQIEASFGGKK